jgi:predicted nucleotidyltransferase
MGFLRDDQSRRIGEICLRRRIELAVLFGSAALGGRRDDSDVDIPLLPGHQDRMGKNLAKLDLICDLGGILEPRSVDLVVLTPDTDPLLLFEIFSGGIPVFEARSGIFQEQRSRAAFLYWDTKKFRRAEAESLRRRVKD